MYTASQSYIALVSCLLLDLQDSLSGFHEALNQAITSVTQASEVSSHLQEDGVNACHHAMVTNGVCLLLHDCIFSSASQHVLFLRDCHFKHLPNCFWECTSSTFLLLFFHGPYQHIFSTFNRFVSPSNISELMIIE